jgi:hypothetical protein
MEDLLRQGAEQEPGNAASAVCPDDQQIDLFFMNEVWNDVRDFSFLRSLAGKATLGIASPSVAANYHNTAFGHAKYQLLYPAASLATGAHWVTVIAVDSGGRSTTFGPSLFTVQ